MQNHVLYALLSGLTFKKKKSECKVNVIGHLKVSVDSAKTGDAGGGQGGL